MFAFSQNFPVFHYLIGIVDDFYLNLLDWSARNAVAVGLGANLFIWNAQTGSIEHLIELSNQQVISNK